MANLTAANPVIGRKDQAYQYIEELKKAQKIHQENLNVEGTCPYFSPADKVLDHAFKRVCTKIAEYQRAIAYKNTSLRQRVLEGHLSSQVKALQQLQHVKTLLLKESATFAQTIAVSVRHQLKTRHNEQSVKTFKKDGYSVNEDLYLPLSQLVNARYDEMTTLLNKANKKVRTWEIHLSEDTESNLEVAEHLENKLRQLRMFCKDLLGIQNTYIGEDADYLFNQSFFYPHLVRQVQTQFMPGEDITLKTRNTKEWIEGILNLATAVAKAGASVNQHSFHNILESAIRRLVPLNLKVQSVASYAFSQIGAMHQAMAAGPIPSLSGRVNAFS